MVETIKIGGPYLKKRARAKLFHLVRQNLGFVIADYKIRTRERPQNVLAGRGSVAGWYGFVCVTGYQKAKLKGAVGTQWKADSYAVYPVREADFAGCKNALRSSWTCAVYWKSKYWVLPAFQHQDCGRLMAATCAAV
jgi:hypothetical protein